MKKWAALTLCSICFFGFTLLSGCNQNVKAVETGTDVTAVSEEYQLGKTSELTGTYEQNDVTCTAGRSLYPSGVSSITLFYQNNLDSEGIYGEEMYLEKENNGIWYQVEPKEGWAWHDIGIILPAKSEGRQEVSFAIFGNGLNEGHYRLIKKVFVDNRKIVLPVTFSVAPFNENQIHLVLEKDNYTTVPEQIAYTIYNQKSTPVPVVLIPHLEKKIENGWEEVPCNGGFCGTPDLVEKTLESDILIKEWYPPLEKGTYRISFYSDTSENAEFKISDEFIVQ